MEFDFLSLIIFALIVGALYFLYTLIRGRSAASNTQSSDLIGFDESVFNIDWSFKQAYESFKSSPTLTIDQPSSLTINEEILEKLAKTFVTKKNTDSPDAKSEHKKNAVKLLVYRAIASVQTATSVQQELEAVKSLQQSNLLPGNKAKMVEEACKAIDEEYKEIESEANQLKKNWGEQIFNHAIEIGGLDAKKRPVNPSQQSKAAASKRGLGATTARLREKMAAKKQQADDDATSTPVDAKAADAAFNELMAAEDRKHRNKTAAKKKK